MDKVTHWKLKLAKLKTQHQVHETSAKEQPFQTPIQQTVKQPAKNP